VQEGAAQRREQYAAAGRAVLTTHLNQRRDDISAARWSSAAVTYGRCCRCCGDGGSDDRNLANCF